MNKIKSYGYEVTDFYKEIPKMTLMTLVQQLSAWNLLLKKDQNIYLWSVFKSVFLTQFFILTSLRKNKLG